MSDQNITCEGFRKLSRRGVLQVGALGALGFTAADFFRAQEAHSLSGHPASTDCIVVVFCT